MSIIPYVLPSLFAFLCLCATGSLAAQCGTTVDAGPDQTVCNGSAGVQLQGNAGGPDLLCFEWQPAAGLSDPLILNPTANVTTTTTYTLLTYAADPATNLLVNGDFDQGTTGWTTDYRPGDGGAFGLLSDEGEYALAPNANQTHNNFAPCTDHTGNGGNQLVVNGAGTPGENVYCQQVTVSPNTTYGISAWIQTVVPTAPAELQFSVNGNLVGSVFTASSTTCDWLNFCQTWNSGAATTAEVCIVNQNTATSGNDFALDDIFFGPFCENADQVTIAVADADAILNNTLVYPCTAGPAGIVINGSASTTGVNITYNWTTPDGNILSGSTTQTPIINATGSYTLTVTYDDGIGFCTDQATIQVVEDPNAAFAAADHNGELTCVNGEVRLSATGSSTGINYRYFWSTTDGNFVGVAQGASPRVDAPGTYLLTVVGPAGCQDTASTRVTENLDAPAVSIATPGTLACGQANLRLDARLSDQTGVQIAWSTVNGRFTGGTNTLTPTVGATGTYRLTLTSDATGCSAFTDITVMGGGGSISAAAPANQMIGCAPATYTLQADDAGPGFSYAWTTPDGNFVSTPDTLTPLIDAPGTYFLTVTDEATGCTGRTTVTVARRSLGAGLALQSTPRTCDRAQITLGSSQNAAEPVRYRWRTPDGLILDGDTTATPRIDAAGTYFLTLIGRQSGCVETASVVVTDDLTPPAVDAGPDTLLTCAEPQIRFLGTPPNGPDLSFSWTTPDGTVDAGASTPNATVTTPGRYRLTVTNTRNGCAATDSVAVGTNQQNPLITAGPDRTLTCRDTAITVGGGSVIFGVDYTWTTPDGRFDGPTDLVNVQVSTPGIYALDARDPATGCQSRDTVLIGVDTLVAAINVAAATLTCNQPEVTLPVSFAGDPDDYVFAWLGPGLVAGANTLTPTVEAGGSYDVRAVNTLNGCVSTARASVQERRTPPAIEVANPASLTCRATAVPLDATGSATGRDLVYSWTDSLGNTISSALRTNVTNPGLYTLTIVDTLTGCAATEGTRVGEDRAAPVLDLAPGLARFTCADTTVTLNAGATNQPLFLYEWTLSDGATTSSVASAPTITVGAGGTYELLIVNPQNGCESRDQVLVVADTTAPTVSLPGVAPLTCAETERRLTGVADPGFETGFLFGGDTVVRGVETIVDRAGRYTFFARDPANGCVAATTRTLAADTLPPVAEAGPDNLLNCYAPQTQLRGDELSGRNVVFTWTTPDGNIAGASQNIAVVDAAGQYRLRVADRNNGCVDVDSTRVRADLDPPVFTLPPVPELTCADTTRQLGADAGATVDLNASYSWSSPTGNRVDDPGAAEITVSEPGSYALTILNVDNGCDFADTVAVGQNIAVPTVRILPPATVTCAQPTVVLDATASSAVPTLASTWLRDGLPFARNNLSPTTGAAGTYELFVQDAANGCVDSAAVVVAVDTLGPVANAFSNEQLNCVVREIDLDGRNSTGRNLSYSWTTADGTLAGPADQPTLTIGGPGEYVLTVTGAVNGCTDEVALLVTENVDTPVVGPFSPDTLTCATTEIELNVPVQGSPFVTLDWTTTDGRIVSEHFGAARVDAPGTYLLVARDRSSQCQAERRVVVLEDVATPIVNLGEDRGLGCDTVPFTLRAAVSNVASPVFTWSAVNGNLLSGTMGPTPTARGPGTYAVEVRNGANGCRAMATVTLTQELPRAFDFLATDPTCRNPRGRVDFVAVEGGVSPYVYSVDGGAAFRPDTTFLGLEAGDYDLRVQDVNGCELRRHLRLDPPRELQASLPNTVFLGLGESVRLNLQTNFSDAEITAVRWRDSLGLDCETCLRPLATPTRTTRYAVDLESEDGCQATANVQLVVDPERFVYFPTAFSPNGDGINDVFHPFGKTNQVLRIRDFCIYDRWGGAVHFVAEMGPIDPALGWDGRHRGKLLDAGVFVYAATVEFVDGSSAVYEGEVILVR